MNNYGIRITLPDDSTMLKSHLLGPGWEYFRWFKTAEERDHAYIDMERQPEYYRKGDNIQQILNKVERND